MPFSNAPQLGLAVAHLAPVIAAPEGGNGGVSCAACSAVGGFRYNKEHLLSCLFGSKCFPLSKATSSELPVRQ